MDQKLIKTEGGVSCATKRCQQRWHHGCDNRIWNRFVVFLGYYKLIMEKLSCYTTLLKSYAKRSPTVLYFMKCFAYGCDSLFTCPRPVFIYPHPLRTSSVSRQQENLLHF